jgi:hypothetical protein
MFKCCLHRCMTCTGPGTDEDEGPAHQIWRGELQRPLQDWTIRWGPGTGNGISTISARGRQGETRMMVPVPPKIRRQIRICYDYVPHWTSEQPWVWTRMCKESASSSAKNLCEPEVTGRASSPIVSRPGTGRFSCTLTKGNFGLVGPGFGITFGIQ